MRMGWECVRPAVVLAEVRRDGILHDLTFEDARANKMLRLAIEKVVNERRFQPATCDGGPVPADIYLKHTFLPR